MRSPDEVKYIQKGGEQPGLVGCNQSASLAYSAVLYRYQKATPPLESVCGPMTGDWELLPTRMMSPKLEQLRVNGIEGRTPACQLIRGVMEPDPPATVRIKRTLCIDTNRNVIVWDKREAGSTTATWMYTSIERDIELSTSELAFESPPGSALTTYDLPIPHHPGELVAPRFAGGTPPRIRSKVDPEYDPGAKKAGVQGTVFLYLVIDAEGRPADVEILRGLDPALDAEALRVVRQWRFYPATKNGQPVTCMSSVEINFRKL
jgi:TonB family protein